MSQTNNRVILAHEVIDALDTYIAYLGEAEGQTLGLLASRGWKFETDFLARGDAIREKIKAAKQALAEAEK